MVGAWVCASMDDCTLSDARGGYRLELPPATYTVTAAARSLRPASRTDLRLAAGQQLTGIDLVLHGGAAEITGMVGDATGGPIAKARVSTAGAVAETAVDGTFSLWVDPGQTTLIASADGYARALHWTDAPARVEILLLPEGTLEGTVVDATTNEPVAGAKIEIFGGDLKGDSIDSDDTGAFRVSKLAPGRYDVTARTRHGYGVSDGSSLVGLGEHVTGIVVKLYPAVHVEGKVEISSTHQECDRPFVSLRDGLRNRYARLIRQPDGSVGVDGVLPGTYAVEGVHCEGYAGQRDYPKVIVADQDIANLIWLVDPAATIEGRVLTKSGRPVEDIYVSALTTESSERSRSRASATSRWDGSYRLTGVRLGKVSLAVSVGGLDHASQELDVLEPGVIHHDFTLDDTGTIRGQVVDATGAPLVSSISMDDEERSWTRTDHSGAFTIRNVRPGTYTLSLDDKTTTATVTVRANETTSIKVAATSQFLDIRGVVIDASGKAIADVFVSAEREMGERVGRDAFRDRWWGKPAVLTDSDGAFTLTQLTPGSYTVSARRNGGGDALVEHVAAGTATKLQIRPTGSIAGVIKSSEPVDEVAVSVRDEQQQFWRVETLFRRRAFQIDELPAGRFKLSIGAAGKQQDVQVDLAEGEHKSGVVIELAPLVDVTGRLVDRATHQPIPRCRVDELYSVRRTFPSWDSDRAYVTDAQGRFTLKNVTPGRLRVEGDPPGYIEFYVTRMIGSEPVDLGDILVDPEAEGIGDAGLDFKEWDGKDAETYRLEVSAVTGPAAKAGIKVGDVVTSINGVDTTVGELYSYYLLRRPPGTAIAIGLARGVTVNVVLAKRN